MQFAAISIMFAFDETFQLCSWKDVKRNVILFVAMILVMLDGN